MAPEKREAQLSGLMFIRLQNQAQTDAFITCLAQRQATHS